MNQILITFMHNHLMSPCGNGPSLPTLAHIGLRIISASPVHHQRIMHHQIRPGQRRLQSCGPNSRTCVLVSGSVIFVKSFTQMAKIELFMKRLKNAWNTEICLYLWRTDQDKMGVGSYIKGFPSPPALNHFHLPWTIFKSWEKFCSSENWLTS